MYSYKSVVLSGLKPIRGRRQGDIFSRIFYEYSENPLREG